MDWVLRKLHLQSGTMMVSIPVAMVREMGCVAHDVVQIGQPFSDVVVVQRHEFETVSEGRSESRIVEWSMQSPYMELMRRHFTRVELADGGPCRCCGQWAATGRYMEIDLCPVCEREFTGAFAFRRRPRQGELLAAGR